MGLFWPVDTHIAGVSSIECYIGYGDGEAVEFSYFLWPVEYPGEVAEIRLEAIGPNGCSAEIADRVLARLGLPIKSAMRLDETVQQLGTPVAHMPVVRDLTSASFMVGKGESYFVDCVFDPSHGLVGIYIVRDDLRTVRPEVRNDSEEGDNDDDGE